MTESEEALIVRAGSRLDCSCGCCLGYALANRFYDFRMVRDTPVMLTCACGSHVMYMGSGEEAGRE